MGIILVGKGEAKSQMSACRAGLRNANSMPTVLVSSEAISLQLGPGGGGGCLKSGRQDALNW